MGLLGFGRIARGVARRLSGFDVQLVAHDPYVPPELAAAAGVELCSVEELLRRSDILSVHVPLAAETSGLLDAAALALLPPGAVVVNSSRGGVVDPGALLEALRSGRLGGAALDVMSTEPPRPDHPLLGRDDVVCTPHMAYYSEDSLLELRMAVARNAALVLRGERPAFVVNPEVLNVP